MWIRRSNVLVVLTSLIVALGLVSPAQADSHDHNFAVDLEINGKRVLATDHRDPIAQGLDGPDLTLTCTGWDEGWEDFTRDEFSGYVSVFLKQRGRLAAYGYVWFSCSSTSNGVPRTGRVYWESLYGFRAGPATVEADIRMTLYRADAEPEGPYELQMASDADTQRMVISPSKQRPRQR